jgi:hypothetical protein
MKDYYKLIEKMVKKDAPEEELKWIDEFIRQIEREVIEGVSSETLT